MSTSPTFGEALQATLAAEARTDALDRLTDRTARLLAEALADGLDSGSVTARLNQFRADRADLNASRAKAAQLRLEHEAARTAQKKK